MTAALAFITAFLAPLLFKPLTSPVEVATPPDPRSVAGLIAWLETKNPYEKYDQWCAETCLMAQYREHHRASLGPYMLLNSILGWRAYKQIAMSTSGRTTFGAALNRARRYQRRNLKSTP